jgi:hypothetical protein
MAPVSVAAVHNEKLGVLDVYRHVYVRRLPLLREEVVRAGRTTKRKGE